VEASKAVLASNLSNAVVPKQLSMIRESNAVHLLFDSPVVADLSSVIRAHSESFAANPDHIAYIFASLVCGLETLHDMNIIYRAVQPESLYVDAFGHVVLMDFRVCKVGIVGSSDRAFTICGASDYLAPEQISQTGHSYPVDLWGLGVLLYEIAIGSHPFSSSSEVATYSKISSFGSKAFPVLKFPDNTSSDLKSLINQLLLPTPEARIGAGTNGFHLLKKHPYFKAFHSEWERIANGTFPSPLILLATEERNGILQEGVEAGVFESFAAPYVSSVTPSHGESTSWLDNIEFV
jgi:serine/threonine protein kinase